MSAFLAADATEVVTSKLTQACSNQPGVLCRTVYDWTHSTYLASGAEVLFATPLRILLILLIAIIVRRFINRTISRVVRNATAGQLSWLGGLRQHTPSLLLDVVEAPPGVRERRQQRADTVGTLLRSTTTFLVFGVALITILGELGINLTPIVASAGIVGVAVGFGAQNLVRDFLTGIFMILEDQYGVGDIIDVGPSNSSNPISGTVEAVSLRITRLRDVNGVVWHVRNGEIVRVGNMSLGWARAVVDVPLAPGTPVEHARTVLLAAAAGVRRDDRFAGDILDDPEVWGVETFTKDSLTVRLAARTAPMKQWEIARALRESAQGVFVRGELEPPSSGGTITASTEGSGPQPGSQSGIQPGSPPRTGAGGGEGRATGSAPAH